MKLEKFSIGTGDRFSHQGEAQLKAIIKANEKEISISPVWNKSNREHIYVHSHPADVRKEADAAVAKLGYKGLYFVDADHINLSTVAPFVETADFFSTVGLETFFSFFVTFPVVFFLVSCFMSPFFFSFFKSCFSIGFLLYLVKLW